MWFSNNNIYKYEKSVFCAISLRNAMGLQRSLEPEGSGSDLSWDENSIQGRIDNTEYFCVGYFMILCT